MQPQFCLKTSVGSENVLGARPGVCDRPYVTEVPLGISFQLPELYARGTCVQVCPRAQERHRQGNRPERLSNSGERSEENFTFLVQIGLKPNYRTQLDVLDLLFLGTHPCTPGFCNFRGSTNPQIPKTFRFKLPWLL